MKGILMKVHKYMAWFSLLGAPVVIIGSWWWGSIPRGWQSFCHSILYLN